MNITGALAKGVGAAGLGLIAYDAHHYAKSYAQMYSTNKTTNEVESLYYDTLSLQTPSRTKDAAKRAILNWEMDSTIDNAIYKVKGYIDSFGSYISNSIIPVGLSALTLLTKGFVSKASAIGLLAYAAVDLIEEFGNKK